MILKLLEKFGGEDFGEIADRRTLRVVWGPVLPRDMESQGEQRAGDGADGHPFPADGDG